MTVDSNVMRKLGKIKAHMESAKKIGSEAEAQAFATMLHELLFKHKLEMSDIEYDAEVKEEPVDSFPVGGPVKWDESGRKRILKDYPDIEIRGKRVGWVQKLGRICSRAYGCQMTVEQGSSRLWFVGRRSNVEVAEYLYITMYRVIETMSWKEYKTLRNKIKWAQTKEGGPKNDVDYSEASGYRESWIVGFMDRLEELLEEEALKRAQEASAAGHSQSLMRIDKDKAAVALWMKDNTSKLPGLCSSTPMNMKGYKEGQGRANEVQRNAGVNAGGQAPRSIGA